MNSQINLTTVNGSYVQQLFQHDSELKNSFNDKSVSVYQLKQLVRDIVVNTNNKSIENKSTSTKRFLRSLEGQNSKLGIMTLVYNSILNGDGLGVI